MLGGYPAWDYTVHTTCLEDRETYIIASGSTGVSGSLFAGGRLTIITLLASWMWTKR